MNDVSKVWYRTSLLGSTLFAVDADGEVISHTVYDPWGNPLTETYTDANFSGLDNANNFTGYTWDEVLGLYFAQNRFYDAENHRFTQEDTIKDGATWYGYCRNNPLIWVDPFGQKTDSASNVAKQLALLEDIASSYLGKRTSDKKVALLVLQFIRRNNYDTPLWGTIAGSIDNDFVSYVKDKNIDVYNYFTKAECDSNFWVDEVSFPLEGGVIDLWHFVATAGGQLYNSGFSDGFKQGLMPEWHLDNLSGWAGDLQTLLKNDILKLGDDILYQDAYNATQRFITDTDPYSSYFSYVDLLSDVDAYNIAQSIKKSQSISKAFSEYYQSGYSTRFTNFSNGLSQARMRSLSLQYTQLKYLGIIKWPLYSETPTYIPKAIAEGTAHGFADYIWSQVQLEKEHKK